MSVGSDSAAGFHDEAHQPCPAAWILLVCNDPHQVLGEPFHPVLAVAECADVPLGQIVQFVAEILQFFAVDFLHARLPLIPSLPGYES